MNMCTGAGQLNINKPNTHQILCFDSLMDFGIKTGWSFQTKVTFVVSWGFLIPDYTKF